MKKLILFALCLWPAVWSAAQNGTIAENSRKSGKRYITNGFWDNWFISANGGGQVYFGTGDSKGPFGKRIAPGFTFAVGKSVTPNVTVRIAIDGFNLKGFTSMKTGYYYGEPDSKGVYRQKWKYYNLHGDIMYNLTNAIGGYSEERVYNLIPYVGFGMAHTFTAPVNNTFAMSFGIINRFRITDAVDINLELKGALYESGFDAEPDRHRGEGVGGVLVGITYKFRKRNFDRYDPHAVSAAVAGYTTEIDRLQALLSQEQDTSRSLKVALLEQAGSVREQALIMQQEVARAATSVSAPFAVFFPVGGTRISDQEMVNLSYQAALIKKSPGKVFRVIGSADYDTGSAARNRELSEQRAGIVINTLVDKFGVNRDQLKAVMNEPSRRLFGSPDLNRVVIIEE